jgi:hypothetical protein
MSQDVIEALAKKDADFLEKFTTRVLTIACDQWAKRINEAFEKGADGTAEYNSSFDEWHRLRMDLQAVEYEITAKHNRLAELSPEAGDDSEVEGSTSVQGG